MMPVMRLEIAHKHPLRVAALLLATTSESLLNFNQRTRVVKQVEELQKRRP